VSTDPFFPFGDMMHDEVQWAVRLSLDAYNAATYATATAVQCRIAHRTRMVRNLEGQEVVSTATIYCAGNPGIGPEDQITMPDGSTPPVLVVKTPKDDMGYTHQEVMV
jgi:hypothetical protein